MRRGLSIIIIIAMIILPVTPVSAANNAVKRVNQKVIVDDVSQRFETYRIDGDYYFKLKDIAYVLNGTRGQFNIGMKGSNRIAIETGKYYTSDGSELVIGKDQSAKAKRGNQKLIVDGKAVNIVPYSIGNSYYYRIQDLGTLLGFYVQYDTKKNILTINTQNEIARAIYYGFIPATLQKDYNLTMTAGQFYQIIEAMIAYVAPDQVKDWKSQGAALRGSSKKLLREDGILALFYAAKILGISDTNIDWSTNHEQLGEPWGEFSWDYPEFPDWNVEMTYSGIDNVNQMTAAFFFAIGREGLEGKFLFEDIGSMKSIRANQKLTRAEGIQAVLRLFESTQNYELMALPHSALEEEILLNAEKRKKDILNSKTEVVIKGNTYYVSNDGDDTKDGLTPATAWKSLDKVNQVKLSHGDGVLFQRGDLWRGMLKTSDGVTYSTYGEGPKPSIYGSPENGASPEKWTLLKGTNNIWIYYTDMYDTGGIVFNEGEAWANRKVAFWDGKQYVEPDNYKKPVKITDLENLTMYNPIDYTGYSSSEARYELEKKGPIYLRCDEGNPGKIYDSIEFLCLKDNLQSEFVVSGGDQVVIDNLCIKYSSGTGISLGSRSTASNCEVAWLGGAIMNFGDFGVIGIVRVGDGITVGRTKDSAGIDNKVYNNYVHHTYDQAFAVEVGPGWNESLRRIENTIVKGNLSEATSGGIVVADWSALQIGWDGGVIMKNLLIEDNYILRCGYGWSHQTPDLEWGYPSEINNGNSSITFGFPGHASEGIVVKNNVLYLNKYGLVGGKIGKRVEGYQAIFTGNTYIQNFGGIITEWLSDSKATELTVQRWLFDPLKVIKSVLGDEKAKGKF